MEILKLYSNTCVPCRMMNPLLEKLKIEKDIKITPIDTFMEHELVLKYNIRSVPTLILLKDGIEVNRLIGSTTYNNLLEFCK